MDINLVVVNLGNSRLSLGTFVAGELKPVTRVPNDEHENWPKKIAEAWSHIAGLDGAAVAGASVNPRLLEEIDRAVEQAADREVQWIGKQIDLPINVLTQPPTDTGVDRILNIAAAYEQMGTACAVVDAGSAVTVDCCNDKGEFLGGAIAPGVKMMLDALHEKTAALPQIDFVRPTQPFGNSTAEAMRQGVYHGIRGLVKEAVESYATTLGYWPDIIATGGDAEKLFEGWELIHAISPDLTLYGIALAYAEHHIKHKT